MAEITFFLKKYNLSLHFFMIFEYFQCLGARPGGLGHILSPRLGFFRFLRFDRRERVPCWEPRNDKNQLKIDPKLNKFFDHFFDRLWTPLGTDLVGFWEPKWTQNWSRIGPKSDHCKKTRIIDLTHKSQ